MARTLVPIAAICIAFSAAAQTRPSTPCNFDGFGAAPQLAEVAGKPGETLVIYRTEGSWTCGYLSERKGAGPAWVKSADLRPITADTRPPSNSWIGKWANGENRIEIRASETAGKVTIEGSGIWRGLRDSVHTGEFAGDAAPAGNHIHFVEGGPESCTIDLTLIGKYLVADDNSECGGANVRFWGVWKRVSN